MDNKPLFEDDEFNAASVTSREDQRLGAPFTEPASKRARVASAEPFFGPSLPCPIYEKGKKYEHKSIRMFYFEKERRYKPKKFNEKENRWRVMCYHFYTATGKKKCPQCEGISKYERIPLDYDKNKTYKKGEAFYKTKLDGTRQLARFSGTRIVYLCPHQRTTSSCRECKGGSICVHNICISKCEVCSLKKKEEFKEHNEKIVASGVDLYENTKHYEIGSICVFQLPYGKLQRRRLYSNGWRTVCLHDIANNLCHSCFGDCPHGRISNSCRACSGKGAERHNFIASPDQSQFPMFHENQTYSHGDVCVFEDFGCLWLRKLMRNGTSWMACCVHGKVDVKKNCKICNPLPPIDESELQFPLRDVTRVYTNHDMATIQSPKDGTLRNCIFMSGRWFTACVHRNIPSQCIHCSGACENECGNLRVKDGVCTSCHPDYVPTDSGASKVACECIDRLQREEGIVIQHSCYNTPSGFERNEYKPPCMPRAPVDGHVMTETETSAMKKGDIFEFLGDEYHGHPSKSGTHNLYGLEYTTLFANTEKKFIALAAAGYTVYYLWETDYEPFSKGRMALQCVRRVLRRFDGTLKYN